MRRFLPILALCLLVAATSVGCRSLGRAIRSSDDQQSTYQPTDTEARNNLVNELASRHGEGPISGTVSYMYEGFTYECTWTEATVSCEGWDGAVSVANRS